MVKQANFELKVTLFNLHILLWYDWLSGADFALDSLNLHITWWKIQNMPQWIATYDIRMLL